MATAKTFDSADAQRIDKQYAAPSLVEQRRRTLDALALAPGQIVVDIGCGPGYLTREIAEQVMPLGRAIGIDTSQPMLDVAAARCSDRTNVEFRHGDATALPFENASIDVVAVAQVFLFVPALALAFAELARVLKPGGRAVVVDTDWDSLVWHSSEPGRMNRFIEIWKQRYVNATVARLFPGHLRAAGLTIEHADAIPIVELAPDDASYSGGQITEVAKYVSSKGGLSPEEASSWADDLRALASRGEYFFALNRYLFIATKSG